MKEHWSLKPGMYTGDPWKAYDTVEDEGHKGEDEELANNGDLQLQLTPYVLEPVGGGSGSLVV